MQQCLESHDVKMLVKFGVSKNKYFLTRQLTSSMDYGFYVITYRHYIIMEPVLKNTLKTFLLKYENIVYIYHLAKREYLEGKHNQILKGHDGKQKKPAKL